MPTKSGNAKRRSAAAAATKLTFSQEQGLEAPPGPLALGILSTPARAELWSVFLVAIDPDAARGISADDLELLRDRDLHDPWLRILADYHRRVLHSPRDEFRRSLADCTGVVKRTILMGDFGKVLDFVQFVLQHEACPDSVLGEVERVLDEWQTAYTISRSGPRVVPRSLPQEAAAFEKGYADLSVANFAGARGHLASAADHLTAGRYADSVRESIHAVEAVAKLVSGQTAGALDPALRALETKAPIHAAFKEGLRKLYAFTSDEKGIRHPALEEPARVDAVDAQFMLGACASFVSYLIGKARRSGLLES